MLVWFVRGANGPWSSISSRQNKAGQCDTDGLDCAWGERAMVVDIVETE